MELTKQQVRDFLAGQKLMSIATFGEFPWVAAVYYTFDRDLNLYFLSSPDTLHCQMIAKNKNVAVSIADSAQSIDSVKKGLQLSGTAERISDAGKIRFALKLWKEALNVKNKKFTYQNMLKNVIKSRMYKVKPVRIKLFDQGLFKVEDGLEPILYL